MNRTLYLGLTFLPKWFFVEIDKFIFQNWLAIIMQVIGHSRILNNGEVIIPKQVAELLGDIQEGDHLNYYKEHERLEIRIKKARPEDK